MDTKILKDKETAGKIIKRKFKKKEVITLIIIIAVAVGIGFLVLNKLGYIKTWQAPTESVNDDTAVLKQLKKIILLPDDIQPTMAIITDVSKLKVDQPEFFADAKNGDRLVIYPTMAIIFDYEAMKIVKVGPVQFNQPEQPVANVPVVKFAVYNGSGVAGAAEDMEKKLKLVFKNIEVTEKTNAVRNDYEKTIVIDLVNTGIDIEKFAQMFNAEVGVLPEGEVRPEGAEILMIVGRE